jgi:putative ABC transport system permease protein
VIAGRIEQGNLDSHAGTRLKLIPLHEQIVGPVKPVLMLLMSAVGLILLIACANVASLLLMRSAARQKEVAIRAALGASSYRVIRQLLLESIVLSVVAGAAGLFVANWSMRAFLALLPDSQTTALPFLTTLRINPTMLSFSFVLSLLTGVVFGLAPALHSARVQLSDALRAGGRTSVAAEGHHLRSAFVVAQVALAVVLLVGAGLLAKSLLRLLDTSPGFDPQNVLTLTLTLPQGKYSEPDALGAAFDRIIERIESLPGVRTVGTVDKLPLQGGNTTRFFVEGDPIPPPGQEIEANVRVVDENYFNALGVPIVAGRSFAPQDNAKGPGIVIINKSAADRLFGGQNPIGRRLRYSSIQAAPDTIVGLVGDIRVTGLDEAIRPILYYAYRQNATAATNLVVRTNTDASAMAGQIRSELRSLEPEAAAFNIDTMSHLISDSPAAFMRRFPAMVIGLFATLALLLSSIGLYGVVSHSVRQQTQNIGVRMALGASGSDILKMVIREGLSLTLIGALFGTVAALGLMRLLQGLLFEVHANDGFTFATAAACVFGVALLACYVPARRATKVDPLIALRG